MGFLTSLSYPLQALAATLFTWSVTALGAMLVLLTRNLRHEALDAMLGFGAGVMLASSFWSLLGPGIALADEIGQISWLVSSLGFMAGGLLLTVGDYVFMLEERRRNIPADAMSDRKRRCGLLITSITLHNIPEGLAVGVAFGALAFTHDDGALSAAWMLALGIGLQNFPEGAAVSLPLRREGMGRGRALWYGQLSGFVEPVAGVLGALLAVTVRELLPFLLCFAAGAMVSVVVSELIPESQMSPRKGAMTLCTMLGFAVMMILDVALG